MATTFMPAAKGQRTHSAQTPSSAISSTLSCDELHICLQLISAIFLFYLDLLDVILKILPMICVIQWLEVGQNITGPNITLLKGLVLSLYKC
jgi:hypothetical protein